MCHNNIEITTYDRLLRGWENSMEMVRDFQNYANITSDNDEVKQAFHQIAENCGHNAAQLRELILKQKAR